MLPEINNKKRIPKKLAKALISDTIRDYGNDPFFVKKANQSKGFPEKHGFPEQLKSQQI